MFESYDMRFILKKKKKTFGHCYWSFVSLDYPSIKLQVKEKLLD